MEQQYESAAQIVAAQGSQVLVSFVPVEQSAWEHVLVVPLLELDDEELDDEELELVLPEPPWAAICCWIQE